MIELGENYLLKCGCMMEAKDDKDLAGRVLRGRIRGRIYQTCKEHRKFKTQWESWETESGIHWKKCHGSKTSERYEPFDIRERL